MTTNETPTAGVPSSLSYDKLKESTHCIISSWEEREDTLTNKRRDLRRDEYDVEAMRANGDLDADSTYLPQRIIDRRIKDEVPIQLQFLEQPDRLLIFSDLKNPDRSTESLEHAFTQWMRYPGWTVPWQRAFDSVNLHGGTPIEVKFDITKPLHCAIDYIRREDLMFPLDATSLSSCEHIIRRYQYMPFELESFVTKHGFNPVSVKRLTENSKGAKRHEKISIYRVYSKIDGIVYIWWFSNTCEDFIKAPEPLKLGLFDTEEAVAFTASLQQFTASPTSMPPIPPQEIAVTEYPIFWLPYEIIEDDKLLASRGRAFRDVADQEAQTELWSSGVNAAIKSSKVYASYDNNPVNPEGLPEAEEIKGGQIYRRAAKFWAFPSNAAEIIQIAMQGSTNAAALNSRVDFAVNNRQDSRKTAKEVTAAQQQQALLSSASISGQSPVFLDIYGLCWRIAQSQILIGAVEGFPIPVEEIAVIYRLTTAGDIDVVTRENKKQIIRETFQYLAGTPIGNLFLAYLVETYFPNKAREWVPAIMSGDPTDLISKSSELLKSSMNPVVLTDEQKQQLAQFIQMLDQYVVSRNPSAGGVPPAASGVGETPADYIPNNQPASQAGPAAGASD